MRMNTQGNYNDPWRTAEDGKPGAMPPLHGPPEAPVNWKAMLALLATCLGLFYIVGLGFEVHDLSKRLDGLEDQIRQLDKARPGEMVEPPGAPSGTMK
jgi:hypothetical protein